MTFEWDEAKNRRNRAKHGVSFEAATLVFDDPHAVGVPQHTERRGALEDGGNGRRSRAAVGGTYPS
jgi:uncharacterized DUF497 family protein